MDATTAYRQIITPDESHNTIPIPRQWFGRTVEVLVFPVVPGPDTPAAASPPSKPFPKFAKAQIEALGKSPAIQRLTGALKGANLPPDITMKQIREMRLAEKYARENPG